tara:strand:- start:107 stop:370 length:264 start_codon:yes stop_codon:yes gene_type:complete
MIIFSPFRLVYELIVFALQAAFIYGFIVLMIIGYIIFLWTNHTPEPIEIIKYETMIESTGLICLRIDGCPISFDKMGKEHCPTCIEK